MLDVDRASSIGIPSPQGAAWRGRTRSPVRPDAEARARRLALAGLAGLLILRLAFAASIPLTEDEAYYRLWSQHLAWGYYDHPPMVAWWLASGRALAGDTPLGARLIAVFASVGCTILVYVITRAAGWSEKVGRRAALWYAAAPLTGFGAILILPDSAASLFWLLTLWAALKARDRPAWWIAAGASAGLAALSKYSALFLAPAMLWWLARSAGGRAQLRTVWPWAACLAAGLVFAGNFAWNADHQWLTFQKQFGRIAPEGLDPIHLPRFLAALALLANPLILPFLVRGLSQPRVSQPGAKGGGGDLILVSTLPFLAYLCLHSLHAAVQAHWPAPVFGSLAILAAVGAEGVESGWARLARIAPAAGLALTTLALAHLALPATDRLGRHDPSLPLRSWPGFAQRVEALRRRTGAGWVGTLNYGPAAELSAVWRSPAPLLQITERVRYGRTGQSLTGPGLVLDLPRRLVTSELADCFAEVRQLPEISRGEPGGPQVPYAVAWVDRPKRDVLRQGCRTFHNGRADAWP